MDSNGRDRSPEIRDVPPDWDEPPPFLGTWKRVYIAVVFYTVALIVILYLLTLALNR